MKCLKRLFILTIIPLHLFASGSASEIKESNKNVKAISNIIKLDRPLNIEFFLQGGYSGWFKIGWTDKDTGQWLEHTSKNITIGFYHKLTIPEGTDKSTIRVEGYTNTGIAWDKYKKIFNHTLEKRTIYLFSGAYYYGIKTWGTTLSPRHAEYNPKGSDLDITNPSNCIKLVLPDIPPREPSGW